MPYRMEFYYNGADKDDKIAVDVYSFTSVGQLDPSAIVYTLEGREPNEEGTLPAKNVWLSVPLSFIKPAQK